VTWTPTPRSAVAPLESVRWAGRQAACRPRSRCHRAGSDGRRLTVWSSVEAILVSSAACNLIVVTATSTVAAVCVTEGGLSGFITNLPALAVVWSALYALIRLGRRWRGVRPPRQRTSGETAGLAVSWRSARRLSAGLALAGCSSPNGPPGPTGTLTGVLQAVGGPSGAGTRGLTGQVTLQGADGRKLVITAGANGKFSVPVTVGTYTATGQSPQYEGDAADCHAAGPVTVTKGATSRVEVDCQES
jgi:hypothetical protein